MWTSIQDEFYHVLMYVDAFVQWPGKIWVYNLIVAIKHNIWPLETVYEEYLAIWYTYDLFINSSTYGKVICDITQYITTFIIYKEAGAMALRLGAQAVFPEDMCLIPSTYMMGHNCL